MKSHKKFYVQVSLQFCCLRKKSFDNKTHRKNLEKWDKNEKGIEGDKSAKEWPELWIVSMAIWENNVVARHTRKHLKEKEPFVRKRHSIICYKHIKFRFLLIILWSYHFLKVAMPNRTHVAACCIYLSRRAYVCICKLQQHNRKWPKPCLLIAFHLILNGFERMHAIYDDNCFGRLAALQPVLILYTGVCTYICCFFFALSFFFISFCMFLFTVTCD